MKRTSITVIHDISIRNINKFRVFRVRYRSSWERREHGSTPAPSWIHQCTVRHWSDYMNHLACVSGSDIARLTEALLDKLY